MTNKDLQRKHKFILVHHRLTLIKQTKFVASYMIIKMPRFFNIGRIDKSSNLQTKELSSAPQTKTVASEERFF